MKKCLFALIALIALVPALSATNTRTIRTINDAWLFTKEGTSSIVNLPHTWNAVDAADDVKGFWRGECTYERTLTLGDEIEGREVFLRFEGAYQETKVMVNGREAGSHIGGYTAFIFDITELVRKGDNKIVVKVDNSYNENIPTLTADFTFFGGIYRDVELVITPKLMISPDYMASSGVLLSTPSVSEAASTVSARTFITNAGVEKKNVVLEQKLIAPDGRQIASVKTKLKLAPGTVRMPYDQTFTVNGVKLWDVDDPQVYRVMTSVSDAKTGALVDQVSNPLGFRYFRFDPNEGFFLNGRHLKILGTNRHQDYFGKGNALPDENHLRDVRLLKDMGGNFLRIAHYPQDPIMVQMCDREGIVNSVEIPVVNTVTCTEAFKNNCIQMAREMVVQGYNHPSTIIWAYMNEVMLRLPFNSKAAPEVKKAYFDFSRETASGINAAIKELDPLRPTMIPCQNNSAVYKESGIGEVPDILGWNIYAGWYSGQLSDFAGLIQKHHDTFPDKGCIITEYGADNDWRCHSFKGERFDFTEEYAVTYHKAYLKVIKEKSFIAGANVWNMNDFYSEGRGDAIPHVNCKGLVTRERVPKDSYWFYKANYSHEPFIMISGHDWLIRGGDEGEVQPMDVYTNSSSVELFLNGKSLGSKAVDEGFATFDVALAPGPNVLEASASKDGKAIHDLLRVDYRAVPKDMGKFVDMSVSLGGTRYFEDRDGSLVWIPAKEYTPGRWGYVGGEMGRRKTNRGSQPYSNQDILGTDQDPLFQMQMKKLDSFKADVPDGHYYVYLYFAELNVGKNKEIKLAYSLGNDVLAGDAEERIFNVDINGNRVLDSYNIRKEDGEVHPVIKKFTVDVENGEGLSIDFSPVKGEAVLNAVRIYRCN